MLVRMQMVSAVILCGSVLYANASESIPEVKDPQKIVVDGKPMTAVEFRNRYCRYDQTNPSCNAVKMFLQMESLKRK